MQFGLLELNVKIKKSLIENFPDAVWVIAEISEINVVNNKHCYLELIEKEGKNIVARSRAIIWSYNFRMLKPYFEYTTNTKLTSGIKVLLKATINFHENYGFSLNIIDIDPTYTLGDLVKQRKEIINNLKNDGVFDMNRQIVLPAVIQRVAIISSKTAAGYTDFTKQLIENEHNYKFELTLYSATMQGVSASKSIIFALDNIFAKIYNYDIVVIIRGGGAKIDMVCFDSYELATNVAQFPLPIITGVGHDKDESIVDIVSHLSQKTPTAVADFLIHRNNNFKKKLYLFLIKLNNYHLI